MNNYKNSELQIIGTTVIALLQWAKRRFFSQTQMQSRSAASIMKYGKQDKRTIQRTNEDWIAR